MLPHHKWADSRGSRIGEAIAGIVLGFFGALALVVLAIAMYRLPIANPISPSEIAVLAVLALVGLFCCITSYRLITGRGRTRDHGLFSPWLLRFLGLLFFGGAAVVVYDSPADVRIAPMVTTIFLGLGCFYLANRQQQKSEQLVHEGNDT